MHMHYVSDLLQVRTTHHEVPTYVIFSVFLLFHLFSQGQKLDYITLMFKKTQAFDMIP